MIAAILGERRHERITRGIREFRILRIHDDLQIDIRMCRIEGMQPRYQPGLGETAANREPHPIACAADRFGKGSVDLGKGRLQPSGEVTTGIRQAYSSPFLLDQPFTDNFSQKA